MRLSTFARRTFTAVRAAFSRRPKPLQPPPLPHHPPHGVNVEKGDTVTVTDFRISLDEFADRDRREGVLASRIPPWYGEYECGACFALRQRLPAQRVDVANNRVDIAPDGWSIEVSLASSCDPLRGGYEIAERALDILASDAFRVSALDDPFRQHSTWYREKGRTILRVVDTARTGLNSHLTIAVRDPSGQLRPGSPAPHRHWHASFAYFRRAQVTSDLDDAYRHLFLAFEALLSDIYPWQVGMGETRWLKDAIAHAARGYKLDLTPFVARPGGNVLKRFMKDQYQATRCALFHAKLGAIPTLPGDLQSREALADATRRLGQLYVQLARLVTGARFGGSSTSHSVFDTMVQAEAVFPLYISAVDTFDPSSIVEKPTQLSMRSKSQLFHQLSARWDADELPSIVRRVGSVCNGEEGMSATVNLTTEHVDALDIVIQREFANVASLRESYF